MKKYIPELTKDHFEDFSTSGVRAMVVQPSGEMVNDFLFTVNEQKNQLHVRNAPSPAATSCFAIADEVYEKAVQSLNDFQ